MARRAWLVVAGGLSSYTFELFHAVSQLSGVEVRFIYEPVTGSSFEHESSQPARPYHLHWGNCNQATVRDCVRLPGTDVVFVYGTRPRYMKAMAVAAIPKNVPVYYAADTNIAELTGFGRTLLRRLSCAQLSKRATASLCLGLSNQLALALLGFERMIDIPVCPVDYEAMDHSIRLGGSVVSCNGKISLLIIARLVSQKNLAEPIAAIARDAELTDRLHLRIAGEGPLRGELERIQRAHPKLQLELLGAVPHRDIGRHIAAADALLLPSRTEPWGIAVVEALGMGKPVIATPAVGAAVSLAGETQAVVLSRSVDADSILVAIHQFMAKRELLSLLAQQAAPTIRAHYGQYAVARAHLALVYGPEWERVVSSG